MSAKKSIANLLLDIEAVELNTETPFRYTSGLLSPIYCDNRIIISYPDVRNAVIDSFLTHIEPTQFDVIAGTATAGIPHAAWLADRLKLPMVYVRANAKAHGKKNQVEGRIKPKQRCLVVEDLVSTGKSALAACEVLREQGAHAEQVLAIFSYQLQSAKQAAQKQAVSIHSLTDLNHLTQAAIDRKVITTEQGELIRAWQKNPAAWEDWLNAKNEKST